MSTPSRNVIQDGLPARDLFARAGVRLPAGCTLPDTTITSLVDDSRAARDGSCFVAVRGTKVDGHAFVRDAVSAGANVVVVDREVPVGHRLESGAPQVCRVLVPDARDALARLAAAFYGLREDSDGDLCLIGLTGTNGKTTVAWLLRSILRAAGCPTALVGTIEYDLVGERLAAPLTTPGPLALCRHLKAARDAGASYAVLEVSSHALDQRRCDGLTFTVGVFTNLSGDHLDYHGTMASYAAAKRRLFDLLGADATAVVNVDDPWGRALADDLDIPVVAFGLDAPSVDVTARIEESTHHGTRFTLKARGGQTNVHCALPGRHNVLNALAAAAAAEALGIEADAIRDGLSNITCVPGRLQRADPPGCTFAVFVDYAHTDAALRHALQALRPITRRRLICVFGCGGDRDRSKRPRMASVAGELADVAYVTSDNPRTEDPERIIKEILPGFARSVTCRVVVQADRRRAIEAALGEAQAGDTVLIAGKGHEAYQLISDRVLPFDDLEVVRDCLSVAARASRSVAQSPAFPQVRHSADQPVAHGEVA